MSDTVYCLSPPGMTDMHTLVRNAGIQSVGRFMSQVRQSLWSNPVITHFTHMQGCATRVIQVLKYSNVFLTTRATQVAKIK